nr:unnamed protein product [Spirometra erinaceieuropaei]
MTSSDDSRNKSHEDLRDLLATVPKADKLIVLDDFNARVNINHVIWRGVRGHHGVNGSRGNGLLHLRTYAEYRITLFRIQTREKATWMHPRSQRWDLLDYALVQQRDHSELTQRMANIVVAGAVAESASVENRWCQLRDTVQSTVLSVLGHARRQHQDWFDDAAISNLLAETDRLRKACVTRPTDDNKP